MIKMPIDRRGLAALAGLALCGSVQAQTVNPTNITSDPSGACGGGSELHNVCITLPPGSVINKVDIFLLFDDTGSFSDTAPALISLFSGVVSDLIAALPTVDLAFGVGRFEDYGGPGNDFSAENLDGRPFTLNQAILRTANGTFAADLAAALANTAPGYGGDGPESSISEGLFQVATGLGFDGDGNGNSNDSGPAGALSTQIAPGVSGDVPAYGTYVGSGDGTLGGVGWRSGSLRIILLATDTCQIAPFTFPDAIPATITGTGSIEPVTAFACSSTTPGDNRFGYVSDSKTLAGNSVPGAVVPAGAGTVQATVNALNALGIRVIGLAPGGAPTTLTGPGADPSIFLSALARLTGALDATNTPLVFDIAGGSAAVAAAIVNAVTTTSTNPIDIFLTTDPLVPGLSMSSVPPVHTNVSPGETACFDCTFTGDGTFTGGSFDLNFRDYASNSIIGTIPVVLVCQAGECFTFEFETEDDLVTPLGNGQSITTPPEFGLLLRISSSGPNLGVTTFDSTPGGPNGGTADTDMLIDKGNILMLQDSTLPAQSVPGFFDTPLDDPDGGDFVFEFTSPAQPTRIALIDLDPPPNGGASVILSDENGATRTYTVPPGWTGSFLSVPGWKTLDLTTLANQVGNAPGFRLATASETPGYLSNRVVGMVVHLPGFGAVDDLSACFSDLLRASATVRNGSGVNPLTLRSRSQPLLGETWNAELDCAGHAAGLAVLVVFRSSHSGAITPYGELLVGGTRILHEATPHTGNSALFGILIPNDGALIGLGAHAQGLCMGAPGSRLSNAVDIVTGF